MTAEQERKAIARYERKLAREKERRATDPEYRRRKDELHRLWVQRNRDHVNAYNRRKYAERRAQEAGADVVSAEL